MLSSTVIFFGMVMALMSRSKINVNAGEEKTNGADPCPNIGTPGCGCTAQRGFRPIRQAFCSSRSPISTSPTPTPTPSPTPSPTPAPTPSPSTSTPPTPSPTPSPTPIPTLVPTITPPVEDCSDMVAYADLKCANDATTTCIELRGPVDAIASKSIPVLITAPHGGQLKPDNDYVDRNCAGNSGWVCSADSYTLQLAEHVAMRFGLHYEGKCPWIVINHLHRSKLDANRELPEAADGGANAGDAWVAFHAFITQAQEKINAIHGNDGNGIKGAMLDFHGYNGDDYLAGGAPYTMYGYRLSENTLQQDPLPDAPTGSITHAAQKLGVGGLEDLVRGAKSLGALVPPLNSATIKGDMPKNCGDPVPSPAIKSPISACPLNPPTLCNYRSGGYDLQAHEANVVNNNLNMNAIQVEVPRCIRKASNWYTDVNVADDVAIWDDFGDKISSGMCAWIDGVFGGPPSC